MKYQVYLTCFNGRHGDLIFRAKDHIEVINKIEDILKDNDGGTAQISGIDDNFYTIIER